jgi:hypothetical protein
LKIIGMMACRNEDWILGLSARAALMWLDELVIFDHASSDRSREIQRELMAELPGRIDVILENNPVWEEMRHRQAMLDRCRKLGATHVVYIDADEVLTGDLIPDVRQLIRDTPVDSVLQLPLLCVRGTLGRVHVSGPWSDGQNVSFAFPDAPHLGWTSTNRGGYDFHHRHPMSSGPLVYAARPITGRRNGLMHLQFVNDRRLRAKHALYKMTEVLRWPGREPVRAVDERYNLAIYGQYTRPADGVPQMEHTIGDGLACWWHPYESIQKYFDIQAVPWQESECRRLVAQHGWEIFRGLDLFGVC